jgi:transcriptional regulator with GAF, ATPase, and Fis domain
LALAELFLEKEQLASAQKHARNALRLACTMSCEQFHGLAHVLRARICMKGWHQRGEQHLNKVNQEEVRSELDHALELAEVAGARELLWKVHYELAKLMEILEDSEASIVHTNKVMDILKMMTCQMGNEQVVAFYNHPKHKRKVEKCQQRLQKLKHQLFNSSPGIDEMDEAHLRTLIRVSSALNAIRDLDHLQKTAISLLTTAFGVEHVLIVLKNERTGVLEIACTDQHDTNSIDELVPLSRNVIEQVAFTGSPFVTSNAGADTRLSGDLRGSGAGLLFCAPLTVRGKTLGYLYADHRDSKTNLKESTINLFAALCNLTAVAIDNALAHRQLIHEKSELEQYCQQAMLEYPELIGKSAAMQKLRARIAMAAASPLDVLVWGESGTGKELVARALHRTGRRSGGKFVPLDCGSLSDSLVESELFGYRKGAFTGALENRPGLFEAADGGVIFLDEISNLSLRIQRKLLRVLQEREVRRIGETTVRKINIQVIAATNKELRQEIGQGRFRKDLFFRLNAMEIAVPPLRERAGDVPLLLEWVLDRVGRSEGGRIKAFTREAHCLMVNYLYPGNVRELKNFVERAYYSTPAERIDVEHLPAEVREGDEASISWETTPSAWHAYRRIRDGLGSFDEIVKSPFLKRQIGSGQVRQLIHLALSEAGGRYRDAFRLLGISAREYPIMMQYLKRNRCYLDFRPYRRSVRQPPTASRIIE